VGNHNRHFTIQKHAAGKHEEAKSSEVNLLNEITFVYKLMNIISGRSISVINIRSFCCPRDEKVDSKMEDY
jgi:hypothetical protein